MSYYATVEGHIKFKSSTSKVQFAEAVELLTDVFDTLCNYNKREIELNGYIKYEEDRIINLLHKISETFDVKAGEIDYIGECSSLWRHILDSEEWKEQYGEIVYSDY